HDGTCHVRLVLFPTDTYSSSVVGFFYFERLRYVVDYPLFIFHRALFEWLMDERNVQGNLCECSSYYSAARVLSDSCLSSWVIISNDLVHELFNLLLVCHC